MIFDAEDKSPFGSIGASIDEQTNEKADRRRAVDKKDTAENISYKGKSVADIRKITWTRTNLTIEIYSGELKGNKYKFSGEMLPEGRFWLADKMPAIRLSGDNSFVGEEEKKAVIEIIRQTCQKVEF